MKILMILTCCLFLACSAAFAANQDRQKDGQSCVMGTETTPVRLADWPPGTNACTKDSDCGSGHKCCLTQNGNRCFRVATCP